MIMSKRSSLCEFLSSQTLTMSPEKCRLEDEASAGIGSAEWMPNASERNIIAGEILIIIIIRRRNMVVIETDGQTRIELQSLHT